LDGLVEDLQDLRERVEDILEALIGIGDLLEQEDIAVATENAGSLIYAAPPSFVLRKSGDAIILGIAPDHPSPLPGDLEAQVEFFGHVRILSGIEPEVLRPQLIEFGLNELSSDYWLRTPSITSAEKYLARADDLLSEKPVFDAEVPELAILDFDKPVRYYRGRWIEPKQQTGRYVGRRKQAYGAPLWCYVELSAGRPRRLMDLPFDAIRHRGCDAAWHLQMAIDFLKKHPQNYSLVTEKIDIEIIKFFSPVPQWVHRRLSAIGSPVEPKGCLMAYAIASGEVSEEKAFLEQSLWLSEYKQ